VDIVDDMDDMDIVDNHPSDIVIRYVVGVMLIDISLVPYLPELRDMLRV